MKSLNKCVTRTYLGWKYNSQFCFYIVITVANISMHEIRATDTSPVWQDIKSKAVNNCYMWDTIYKWVNISDINVAILLVYRSCLICGGQYGNISTYHKLPNE